MKLRTRWLLPLLASSLLAVPVCKGTVVFSDSFTNAPGTLIVGKLPEVGSGAWTSGGGSGDATLAVSSVNSLDTAGKSVAVFGGFTAALGVGQILTVQCDTLNPASGTFLTGNTSWGGISLYTGHTTAGTGSERMFFGNPSAGFWGTDGAAIGRHFGTDTNEVNHVTFTYAYSSGAWTLSTTSGYSTNGTGTANLALNGFRVGCGTAYPNVDNLTVDISAVPVFSFVSATPVNGSYSASVTNVISVQTTDGAFPVNTSSIVMQVDGNTVTPSIIKSANVTTISYVPIVPLSAGSLHTALVTLADTGGTMYTNTWSFTTGYSSLPVTVLGPIVVAYTNYSDTGLALFTTNGDGWIGTNYNRSSSKTLYTRYTLEFDNLAGETGTGGGYGGLHFFSGGNPQLIVGNNWNSLNWSYEAETPALIDLDLNVEGGNLPVNVGVDDWHTIVVRTDYVPNGNDTVSIYFDPDFTQTEQAWVANNPGNVTTLSSDVTFDSVYLRCGNGSATCTFSNIMVAATSDGVGFVAPAEPTFQNYVPAVNASSAPVSTPIGVNVLFGSYGIGTNTVTMTLDGNPVAPTFTVTANSIGINYQPPSAFAPGSAHSVEVSLTDSNNTPYYANWSFTVDSYPTLPVTMAGPFDAYEGTSITLWTSQNGWLDNSFGPNSTNTLYTRFSMVFYDFPQTDASAGGSFGGLQFFQDNTERLITGNAFTSTNWSFDAKEGGEIDVSPATPIVVGEWHTFVIKSVYASNAPTAESIWLDPDFTKSLASQPQAPTTASLNNTFNQILLRCGNGSTYAEFTNIVLSATAVDLGFPPSVAPGLLSIQNGQLSWTGKGTLQNAPVVTGPWTEAADQTNPQALSTTNAAEFYRLQQ